MGDQIYDFDDTLLHSGSSVSISGDGNRIVIGGIGSSLSERYDEINTKVKVYEFVQGSWIQNGQDIEGEGKEDWMGYSVAISSNGEIFAVGAPMNDGERSEDSGHVRVYEFHSSR